MKRLISISLTLLLLCTSALAASPDIAGILQKTADAVQVPDPGIGEVGGDWAILGLARSGRLDSAYAEQYIQAAAKTLTELSGVLSQTKYTDYARVTLALTALGADTSDFAGFDLTAPLADYDKVTRQGINGAVHALLALDAGGDPADGELRSRYLDFILVREKESGGFALDDEAAAPDADLTAMALCALYPYRDREQAAPVTERALAALRAMEGNDGTYPDAFGVPNCESTAQAMIALCTYGEQPTVAHLNGLLSFYRGNDGFSHLAGDIADRMPTEQALLALCAYDRLNTGKSGLYRMTDAAALPDSVPAAPAQEAKPEPVTLPFADLEGHWAHDAVATLYAAGAVNGVSDTTFEPDRAISRAELCTLFCGNFTIPATAPVAAFSDVPESDWFHPWVSAMNAAGIVQGNGDGTFAPHHPVTRAEAAVMLARIAGAADMDETAVRNHLAQFDDYTAAPGWSRAPLAWCVAGGIFHSEALDLRPNDPLTRAEACALIVRLKEAM